MANFLDGLFTTPGVASQLATNVEGVTVDVRSTPPEDGQVLTAVGGRAGWADPTGGGGSDPGVDEVARAAAAAAQADADAAQSTADAAQSAANVAQSAADSAAVTAAAAHDEASAAQGSIAAHVGTGGAAHALASLSAAGFFSPAEKAQLAALVAGGGGGGGGAPLTVLPGMHAARAYRIGSASVAGGTFTLIPFNAVKYDPAGLWSAADSGFKPKLPGYYLVTSRVEATTGVLYQMALIGSTSYFSTGDDQHGSWAVSGSGLLYCNGTTDTITVKVNATSPWNTFSSDDFNTWVEIVGPFGVSPESAGGSSSGSSASNMYWAKPSTPDAFDDEFERGSPDLAVRGWLAVNSAGVAMTRAGDVDPWGNASAIPASQYRSTLTASGLLIQCSVQMNVLKPVSGSFQLRTYAHPASFPSGGANYCGPAIANNTLLTPASTKYAYILHYGGSEEAARHDSGHVVLQNRPLATAGEPGALNQLLDWNDTSKALRWLSTRPWGWTNFNGSYTWAGFSATHAGLTILTNQSTPHTFAVVRFIRKAPQDSYPTAVSAAAASSGSSNTNRFWARPANADPFDDEFDLGSNPDLAARGWTVRNGVDGAVQTRVGDVIWTGNPGLAANQYRSTITRDGLCMQTSIDTWVYKPASGSLQLRGSMQMSAPYAGGFYCGLQAWNEAFPVLNATLSRVYVSPQGGNLIAEQMVPNNAYTTLASVSAGTPEVLPASEMFLDLTPAAQRYWAFTIKGFARLEAAGAISPFNLAVAGFNVATHGSTAALRWATIKYVRKAAQGSFPV